ncbi:hypothetical protein BV25DRAFT_872175 [Artomyces pyxidatus]|uniref:Uncharacterized protein n=1 Tax=Artomyces pyxidatus TaxID=48021 RepID=A0ACB8TH85_9AGAM|nr:hypothetical protein BV25DRAFT_872175 [Artomyces pyxidatus]
MSSNMFSPALNSSQTVDVPPSAKDGGVKLLFRARLGSADALAHLKRDGVQVQAWTNAPVVGLAPGVWAAHTFGERPSARPPQVDDVPLLELFTPADVEDEPHTLFLTLHLRPLPLGQAEAGFSLTYRLLYRSGEVRWLGAMGNDFRCVLRRSDPWLAPPAGDSEVVKGDVRTFGTVAMKEGWGCWAIGQGSVQYIPQGSETDRDATFMIFVPRRSSSTFALHQPIILHGKALRLGWAGVVTCAAATPTRVYTAITSERELACALPTLDLVWLGIHDSHALVASPAHAHPVFVHAIPLLTGASLSEAPSVELDLSALALPTEDPSVRRALFGLVSKRVIVSAGTSDRVRLSVGPHGGTCAVSPVYSMPRSDSAFVSDEGGAAIITPHTVAAPVMTREAEPEVPIAVKNEDEEDTSYLEEPIAPPPAPVRTTASPARLLQYLFPLMWPSFAMLMRSVFMRFLTFFYMPLGPVLPKMYFPPPPARKEEPSLQVRSLCSLQAMPRRSNCATSK